MGIMEVGYCEPIRALGMSGAATGLQSIADLGRDTDVGFPRVANLNGHLLCDKCTLGAQLRELSRRMVESPHSSAAGSPGYGAESRTVKVRSSCGCGSKSGEHCFVGIVDISVCSKGTTLSDE